MGDLTEGALVAVEEEDGERRDHDRRRWVELETLYRTERAGLVRLATLLTGDPAVGEELVQEAFVRLHPRLDVTREPGVYLRTIVVNLSRGHLRRANVAERNRPSPEAPQPDLDLPEGMSDVWQALDRLSERRRTALVLRYWLDLSDQQIAEHLNVRPATVRSLIHRGLHQLEEELAR